MENLGPLLAPLPSKPFSAPPPFKETNPQSSQPLS